jgi:FkbM family methyltransferase
MKYFKLLINKFKKITRYFFKIKWKVDEKYLLLEENLKKWKEIEGDLTVRLNYKLNPSSTVFDLGGYKGQWTSDIFAKYLCRIYVFEPCQYYFQKIKNRFENNSFIQVYQYGLGSTKKNEILYIQNDGSSIIRKSDKIEEIKIHNISEFMKQNKIECIDLMKINIEGAEYELLEYIINSGLVYKIRNIQVQFHDFFLNADQRMKSIQVRLNETHSLTYQFEFIWENWQLKNDHNYNLHLS